MAQLGNSMNSKLNRVWGKHVKKHIKRLTSKIRRQVDKKLLRSEPC